MRTTKFVNEYLENAKEQMNGGHGLAQAPARRSPRGAAPTRPARRRRGTLTEQPVTRITAKVDIGFGNTLFIRGEGAGLSWDKGQPLDCLESSIWMWSGRHSAEPVTFKLLVNDQLWCRGANMTAPAGAQAEVVPAF